jgi:hypothetical protein
MNRRISSVVHIGALVAILSATSALGHHAASVYYDVDTVIEVRGVISDLRWQNPHIAFTLTSRDAGGDEVDWLVESNSVSTLRQLGVTADQIEVGSIVTLAGSPARQQANRMSGNNLLTADGRELVLWGGSTLHFNEGTDNRRTVAEVEAVELGDTSDLGMFRVWSSVTGDPNQDRMWNASYPLTDAARAFQAAWDPVAQNPHINCEPKGMPGIVDPPYPMELIDQGDTILILQEEFDTVRTVHMSPATTPSNPVPSLLGHSVGHWDGDTLVVETTRVNWPYFDHRGLPQGADARFTERFTASANGRRLNYTIDVVDPDTFTEPVRMDRFWIWIPENTVERYDCTPL